MHDVMFDNDGQNRNWGRYCGVLCIHFKMGLVRRVRLPNVRVAAKLNETFNEEIQKPQT